MNNKPLSLKERYSAVNARIDKALKKALRNRSGLTLVAVTKRHPLSVIQKAYALEIRNFGESQIQEGVPKVKASPDDIHWHFIGHLQKNKVRKAVTFFQTIHSIDSLSLLQRVGKIAAEERLCPNIFLQVNYALDPDKQGLHPEATSPVLEVALSLKHVTCVGLMGIPPLSATPDQVASYYRGLASLRDELKSRFPEWPGKLSMGMSDDFEIAIREGSHFIRVGTALLGERH